MSHWLESISMSLVDLLRKTEVVDIPECGCCDTADPVNSGHLSSPRGAQSPIGTFSKLEFNLSERCNLACSFCYAKDGREAGPDMERTRATIRWFMGQADPTRRASVTIFGGEPLVEWPDLTEAVAWTREEWPERDISFAIVSNMTLLSQERLDWLIDHQVRVAPSIDGDPESEDAHRKYASGKGASGEVYDAARRLLRVRPNTSCRMTVTPETVGRVAESVRFLCEKIGFKRVNPIMAGGIDWQPEAVEEMKRQAQLMTGWWIAQAKRGKRYGLYHLDNMLPTLANGRRRDRLCDAGQARVAIDVHGNLWPCHRFTCSQNNPDYRLGNLTDGVTNHATITRLRAFRISDNAKAKSDCAACSARLGCHAWCIYEAMRAGRPMAEPPPHQCAVWPTYMAEARRAGHAVGLVKGGNAHGDPQNKILATAKAPPLSLDADAPLIFFCTSEGYRVRHTTFFARPFAEAGWRVHEVNLDHAKPFCGVLDAVATEGVPDAIVQWEEHGVLHAVKPWRDLITWCYTHGVAPLSIDFGYLGHYQSFMLDIYRPDGYSAIGDDWASVSSEPIDWLETPAKIQDYRRRVLRGYNDAKTKPPLVEGEYVAVYMQQHAALSRIAPRDNTGWVKAVIKALAAKGLQAAFKTAPSTAKPAEFPPDAIVFTHEDVPNDTSQRLAVHARYCLINSSSISNEFVLNDLPVVAVGRSWFMERGVFTEPGSWADMPAETPEIDTEARNKYLRWWLGRQFISDDGGDGLNKIMQLYRERTRAAQPTGSTITCVYAPDAETEAVASASLRHTINATPSWRHVVAIDAASPAFCLATSREAVTIASDEGRAPRMGKLTAAAIGASTGDYVFTVEHDVKIDAAQVNAAVDIMENLPRRVAGLYLQSHNEAGRPNYPWVNDWAGAEPWADGFRVPKWPTLSTTLWRRSALADVDFSRVPRLEFVDGYIGDRLREKGWMCLMTDKAWAIHRPHTGRKSLSGAARTLSIGHRNIWAQRGIRFGWNGDPDLDVRGDVPWALPFDADSFREVYLANKLRDATPEEVETFAAEAHRILSDGARLDICGGGPIDFLKTDPRFRVVRWEDTRVVLGAVKRVK